MLTPVAQSNIISQGSWSELTDMAFSILPPEIMASAAAGIGTGLLAVLLLGGKKKKKKAGSPSNVLEVLRSRAEPVELCVRRNGSVEALGSCVVERVDGKGVLCRFSGGFDPDVFHEGRKVAMVFTTRSLKDRKVNALPSSVLKFTLEGGSPGVLLATPAAPIYLRRRQHQRKRVIDQQFVRVRLWQVDAQTTDIDLHSARPTLSVNAFDHGSGPDAADRVINISSGGMALRIASGKADDMSDGTRVTLNVALFSFREKTFKDHWYSGTVRNTGQMDDGALRLGISFDRYGLPGETDAQPFTWHPL